MHSDRAHFRDMTPFHRCETETNFDSDIPTTRSEFHCRLYRTDVLPVSMSSSDHAALMFSERSIVAFRDFDDLLHDIRVLSGHSILDGSFPGKITENDSMGMTSYSSGDLQYIGGSAPDAVVFHLLESCCSCSSTKSSPFAQSSGGRLRPDGHNLGSGYVATSGERSRHPTGKNWQCYF